MIPYVNTVGIITCNDSHVDCKEGKDKNMGAGGRLIAEETPSTGTAAKVLSINRALK